MGKSTQLIRSRTARTKSVKKKVKRHVPFEQLIAGVVRFKNNFQTQVCRMGSRVLVPNCGPQKQFV